jgi:hypothetical protein
VLTAGILDLSVCRLDDVRQDIDLGASARTIAQDVNLQLAEAARETHARSIDVDRETTAPNGLVRLLDASKGGCVDVAREITPRTPHPLKA